MEKQEIWRDIPGYEGMYQVSSLGRVKGQNGVELSQHDNGVGYNKVHLAGENYLYVHRLVAQAFPDICGEWFEGCQVDHKDTDPENNYAWNLRVCTASGNMMNPLTREHNSKAQKELWKNEEYRKRISEGVSKALTGRVRSEAERKAISEGRKGMTFSEEHKKHLSEARKGKYAGSNSFSAKKVAQYDKKGNWIRDWDSVVEAANATGVRGSNISSVCRGEAKTCGGFVWKYPEGTVIKKITLSQKGIENIRKAAEKRGREIVQMDPEGNELKIYTSASEASRQTGISQGNITECCRGKRGKAGGFIWKYVA